MKIKSIMRFQFSHLLFLGLLIGIVASGCKPKQPKTNNKTMPADVAAKYREDAARLTVRELNTSRQSGENEGHIPAERVAFFYDLLSKAYWMSQKVDSIPAGLNGTHTLANPNLKEIMVVLEDDAEFKENWAKGSTLTANLYLNQLLSRFKFKVKNYRESGIGPTATLESADFINTQVMAQILEGVEGIKNAQAEGMMGDGDDITWGSDSKKDMALKFSIGQGDCPSGCIYRKYWIFYVTAEGQMTYMGTRGSLPDEVENED
jgi:hypothetical protein